MKESIRVRKYKVCILTDALEFRGLTIYAYYLIKGILKAGHKVLLIARDGSLNEIFKKLEIKIIFYERWKNFIEKEILYRKLSSMVQKEEIDLIHIMHPDCIILGKKLANIVKKNFVVTIPFPLSKKDSNLLNKRCRGVIAISNNVMESLVNVCQVNRKDISLIPGGVDFEDFENPPLVEWEGFGRTVVIAGIGWFDEDISSQKYFLESVKMMKGLDEFRRNKVEYAIVGAGPDEEKYRRLAKKHNIVEDVHFLVDVTDFFGVLSMVDIFVIPYQKTGLGLTSMYILASGRPCIVFGTGSVYEVVKHNETGIIVEKGDVQGIVSAISDLLNNEEKAKMLGENARKFVRENFNLEEMTSKILGAYDSAMS